MDELFQTDFPQMEMFSRSIRGRGGTRVTNRRTMEIEIMISKRREPGGPGFDAYARETCLFPFFPSSSTPFRCTRQPRAYSRPASVKKSCVISSWTSGHLPVRVAQNFANVMTVMRSPRELEKNSKNSFLIPLREFERGIYSSVSLSSTRVELSINISHHRDHSLNYSHCSYTVLVFEYLKYSRASRYT